MLGVLEDYDALRTSISILLQVDSHDPTTPIIGTFLKVLLGVGIARMININLLFVMALRLLF